MKRKQWRKKKHIQNVIKFKKKDLIFITERTRSSRVMHHTNDKKSTVQRGFRKREKLYFTNPITPRPFHVKRGTKGGELTSRRAPWGELAWLPCTHYKVPHQTRGPAFSRQRTGDQKEILEDPSKNGNEETGTNRTSVIYKKRRKGLGHQTKVSKNKRKLKTFLWLTLTKFGSPLTRQFLDDPEQRGSRFIPWLRVHSPKVSVSNTWLNDMGARSSDNGEHKWINNFWNM
jgi:hypothetical protein